MSTVRGLLISWRDHRRARRQQALERDYFERRRRAGSGESAPSTYQHTNGVWFWIGAAGDGGGGGGDGGGGGA